MDTAVEATRAINKIIAFENSTPGQKALLIGHTLDASTNGGDYKEEVYNNEFPTHWSSLSRYQKDGNTGNNKEFNELNSNKYQVVNHLGHGFTNSAMGLVNSDVDNLTNATYYLVYTQSCYSNSIDNRGGPTGPITDTTAYPSISSPRSDPAPLLISGTAAMAGIWRVLAMELPSFSIGPSSKRSLPRERQE